MNPESNLRFERGNAAVVSGYVEKNNRGWAVPVAVCPYAIGAGFAETGCFLASWMSSCSILRCSCGMGRLGCVMSGFFHSLAGLHSWPISNDRFRTSGCCMRTPILWVQNHPSTYPSGSLTRECQPLDPIQAGSGGDSRAPSSDCSGNVAREAIAIDCCCWNWCSCASSPTSLLSSFRLSSNACI